MSKRRQGIMPDDEFDAVRHGPELGRESLRPGADKEVDDHLERRIAAVLRFARHRGPMEDIDEVLAETERSRGLA